MRQTQITVLTGAATLCAVLSDHLASTQSELYSNILCWMMLPFLLKDATSSNAETASEAKSSYNVGTKPTSSASLWIVASSIAVVSFYRMEYGLIGLFPALTPLLLLTQRHSQPEITTTAYGSSLFSPLVDTTWGTTFVASFAILTLSNWTPQVFILSSLAVVAMLVVYTALMPRMTRSIRLPPIIDLGIVITPLSARVLIILLAALIIQATAFGFTHAMIAPTLFLGLTKALSWYFTVRLTQFTSWHIATAIGTFAVIATRNSFTQPSNLAALAHVIASLLSLGQVVQLLPKQARAKEVLWIFALIPLVPYVANQFVITVAQRSIPRSLSIHAKHPVEALFRNATESFDNMLQRQSQSYAAAHSEYQRRYSMEPPPGFEAWYNFAASHHSQIIDDYDSIYDSISPFWRISGKDVSQSMSDAQNSHDSELWLCEFSSERAKTRCSHPHRTYDRHISTLFDRLLSGLDPALPDVKFLVNHLDEPRLLLQPGISEAAYGTLSMTDLSRQPVWDTITKACPSRYSTGASNANNEILGLPFITNITSAMDLCQHPEYKAGHGLLTSPTSFRLIEGSLPILSTGSLSTMGDILYPSPAYIEPEFQYVEAQDVEWEQKSNNLYWAGSTTGGFALHKDWRSFHRQRFVQLAQNLETRRHSYLREKDGAVGCITSRFLNTRLFDVAFTRIFQCERSSCRDQHAYFNMKPWADKDRALRSRLVFDIDGNGISGRYYKLLASKSVPFKQTLLREWHDERLVPWLHYVPVSQSMDELPELVLYLTSTETGQQRAREIAEQGRDWFSKAFREHDLSIYTYRLLLELARLQDQGRQGR